MIILTWQQGFRRVQFYSIKDRIRFFDREYQKTRAEGKYGEAIYNRDNAEKLILGVNKIWGSNPTLEQIDSIELDEHTQRKLDVLLGILTPK
jgi:hypothetical protein